MSGGYLFLIAVTLWAQPDAPVAAGEVRPHPCQIDAISEQALCATYPVWEDRDRKTGRKIGLNIVILPALAAEKSAAPLFLFHGGPGAPATELVPGYARYKALRAHRDLVFVDQRGTGRSNPLNCDLYGDPENLQIVISQTLPLDAFRAC